MYRDGSCAVWVCLRKDKYWPHHKDPTIRYVGFIRNLSLVLSSPVFKNNNYFGGRKYLTPNSAIGLPCKQFLQRGYLASQLVPLSGETPIAVTLNLIPWYIYTRVFVLSITILLAPNMSLPIFGM